jgi:putative endonuclease
MTAGESKGQTTAPDSERCFVYMLLCADESYYVSVSADPVERERVHNEGHGAEHTAARLPVRLVYSEAHQSWSAARRREIQLKRWSHSKKKALVAGNTELLHRHAKRRRYAANSSKHQAD